jgi:putative transposase
MSPSERKTMINRDRADSSVTKQCKLLKISRSSLYYAPVGVNDETLGVSETLCTRLSPRGFEGSSVEPFRV